MALHPRNPRLIAAATPRTPNFNHHTFMKLRTITSLLTILFTTLSNLQAHEVWIEDTQEGGLVVRFAEFGGEYEKSPGALDSLSLPTAFTFGSEGKPKTAPTERKSDHFLLVDLSPKSSAHIETAYDVMGGGDKPARKPFFYARWHTIDAGAAKPALTFDLVPTSKPGEIHVTFRGKPLPGAKIIAYLPGGAEEELTADAEGLVRVAVEKPGFYLLVGKAQREAQNGFWGGRAYDTLSHNCSLAWRVPTPKR
jgi:hypothetical protein